MFEGAGCSRTVLCDRRMNGKIKWKVYRTVVIQARSQDLERGGSFSVSADRRISVCDPNFLAGVWGRCKPLSGVRGRAQEANAF